MENKELALEKYKEFKNILGKDYLYDFAIFAEIEKNLNGQQIDDRDIIRIKDFVIDMCELSEKQGKPLSTRKAVEYVVSYAKKCI